MPIISFPSCGAWQLDYGTPLACVHDMGTGIGKDYLEPAYARLRNCLRSHATSSRLHALVREMRQCLDAQSDQSAAFAKAITTTAPLEDTELISLASVYSLSLWALQGKHRGGGYGFP